MKYPFSKAILSLTGACLPLIGLELYLRLFPGSTLETNNSYQWNRTERISKDAYADIFPWRFDRTGYYQRSEGRIEYAFNQHGARAKAAGPELDAGKAVVVIGDSLTFGFGLRFEDTYPRLAESCLDRRGLDVRLFNLARPANDGAACARSYRRLGKSIPHQLVIYGLHWNDLIEFPTSHILNVRHRCDGYEKFIPVSYRFLAGRIETILSRNRAIQDILERGNPEQSYYRRNLQSIRDMKSLAAKNHAAFLVVILPILIDLDRYPFEPLHKTLHGILERENIDFLDLLPAFAGHKAEDFWILPFDQHPNAAAARLIAAELCGKLARDYGKQLRKQTDSAPAAAGSRRPGPLTFKS